MRSGSLKTILLFLALGFLVIWFMEFRRTSLAESYWLLLLVLTCLFWYQLINLRAPARKPQAPVASAGEPKGKASKTASKKKSK